ncbi:MAG: CRISPR-associated endoribonuclease Cas6 [Lachnospiraceae bacterium]|nr:CRISPR-associated endoribonuclease Cas6 [Lachnospiraceae bacterium]
MDIKLNTDIEYKKLSALQGVLFEHIREDYRDELHSQKLHPYSQYLYRTASGDTIWRINTLNEEAYNAIIEPLNMDSFCAFHLAHGDMDVEVVSKSVEQIKRNELIKRFNEEACGKYIRIQFITPTAFKQNKRYRCMPDMRLIYQSLMMRYSEFSPKLDMFDEETLEQLSENSLITGYKLKTMSFPMEGMRITGFVGNITIRNFGSEIMSRYIRLLAEFGEYSGIGIKTGMGMGAIRIIKEKSGDA